MALACYISRKDSGFSRKGRWIRCNVADKFDILSLKFRTWFFFLLTSTTYLFLLQSHQLAHIQCNSFLKGLTSTDSSESGTLSYCAVYSSSCVILLVWARTTTQSNCSQQPVPELLFSLITVMSRGMGRAGAGLWTHPQSKERNKYTCHSFCLFLFQWSSCNSSPQTYLASHEEILEPCSLNTRAFIVAKRDMKDETVQKKR